MTNNSTVTCAVREDILKNGFMVDVEISIVQGPSLNNELMRNKAIQPDEEFVGQQSTSIVLLC